MTNRQPQRNPRRKKSKNLTNINSRIHTGHIHGIKAQLRKVRSVSKVENIVFTETPILYGESAMAVRKEILRTPSKKNKERQKMLLEILDRVTK